MLEGELAAVGASMREREAQLSNVQDTAKSGGDAARTALKESQRKVCVSEGVLVRARAPHCRSPNARRGHACVYVFFFTQDV